MHRTTVTLPQKLVDDLLGVTQGKNKTQAVIFAIEEEIRKRKLEKIRKIAGSMEFDIEAEELRHGSERLG